eukprot:31412-Pelagococcus_subviridis.AAC.19
MTSDLGTALTTARQKRRLDVYTYASEVYSLALRRADALTHRALHPRGLLLRRRLAPPPPPRPDVPNVPVRFHQVLHERVLDD